MIGARVLAARRPHLAVALLVLLTACESVEGPPGPGTAETTSAVPPGASQQYPPGLLEPLRDALRHYEAVREQLASDSLDELAPHAGRLAGSLAEVRGSLPSRGSTHRVHLLEEATAAARALGDARSLAVARRAFGEVSRALILLSGPDPRLTEGRTVYACPMTETFPRWIEPADGRKDNPYMGTAMPTCGSASGWELPAPEGDAGAGAFAEAVHGGEVAHYTCSMHPSVEQQQPGTCPICSMDLTAVSREELETGIIRVGPERRQAIGVRTGQVSLRAVSVTIRTVGTVTYDETRVREVTVKNQGWVRQLLVDQTGQRVRRGQPLMTLYSPELLAAQEELLSALASQRAARQGEAPHRADYLVEAARRRLALWDVPEARIAQVERTGEPLEALPVPSPVSGFVVDKHVLEGAAVQPGETLYRVADLDRVWLEAQLYESELPLVEVGQEAEVTFPYLPGRTVRGRVSHIHPYLEAATRTGTVRIELPNPDHSLKPDMYANVVFEAERGERLVVPEEAVIYAGPRRVVFVDLGGGRLEPRTVELGVRSGDVYEVLAGLEPGERVVTSGNFLIAAESRLKSAMGQWR